MTIERRSNLEPAVEVSVSDLKHPVTQEYFHYQSILSQKNLAGRNIEGADAQSLGYLKQCVDLEDRRQKLEQYVRSLGINEKTTPAEVEAIKKRILTFWENGADVADAFDDLVAMREHVYTSHDLLDKSDEYFRRMRAAQALGIGDKPFDTWNEDDCRQISDYICRHFTERVIPFNGSSQRKRYVLRPDEVETENEQTPWGIAAVDFAHDHENDCLVALYNGLAEDTKDTFGVDIEYDKPVIHTSEVKTYKDAQRYSRPLPELLKPLFPKLSMSRYDIGAMRRYDDDAFYDSPNLLRQKAELLLSSTELRGLIQGETATEAEILTVSRMLYPKLIEALQAGTELYRPNAEEFILNIAATVLTKGDYSAVNKLGYPDRSADEKEALPLSGYVPRLRRLAFRNEVDLNPLYKAMNIWLKETPVDGERLCNGIDSAYQQIMPVLRKHNVGAIQRMLNIPDSMPEWQRNLQYEEANEEWEINILQILSGLDLPAPWTAHIRQFIFNTATLTSEGEFVNGTGSTVFRSPHTLKEIKAEILKATSN